MALKNKLTYEIMDAQLIGLNQIVLKHSGRNAFRTRLKELGFELSETELNKAFLKFKDLADKKRNFRLGFGRSRMMKSNPARKYFWCRFPAGSPVPPNNTCAPQMVKN